MRIKDRRRHQFGRLVAGIAEHHALVAGTFILITGSIDALRDIARLRVDEALDLCPLPVKPFLLVADVADRVPRHVDQHLAGDRGGAARLAGQDDAVCRRHRLDAAARLRLGGEEGVDNRIRNAVANLVGVPFGHRLAGKDKIVLRQDTLPSIGPRQRPGIVGLMNVRNRRLRFRWHVVEAAAPSVKQDCVGGLV